MSAYLSLFNFTEQGIHNVKGTLERVAALREAAKAVGGRVIGVWYLMGQYDGMIIFEAPDDETAMRQLVANGLQGNNRSTTMRAFSEEEMGKVLAGLP
jgi:uncharacterized protein with GYD domain